MKHKSIVFDLSSEFIELIRLLKLLDIAESGAQAKIMVDEGMVSLNGEPEFRKRAKLRTGDKVKVLDLEIQIQ